MTNDKFPIANGGALRHGEASSPRSRFPGSDSDLRSTFWRTSSLPVAAPVGVGITGVWSLPAPLREHVREEAE